MKNGTKVVVDLRGMIGFYGRSFVEGVLASGPCVMDSSGRIGRVVIMTDPDQPKDLINRVVEIHPARIFAQVGEDN